MKSKGNGRKTNQLGPTSSPRKSLAVDSEIKAANLRRLRRIEGQIRGIATMVRDQRYCADILMQISAVHKALDGVSARIWKNHLRHCVTDVIRSGGRKAEAMYEELERLIAQYGR